MIASIEWQNPIISFLDVLKINSMKGIWNIKTNLCPIFFLIILFVLQNYNILKS